MSIVSPHLFKRAALGLGLVVAVLQSQPVVAQESPDSIACNTDSPLANLRGDRWPVPRGQHIDYHLWQAIDDVDLTATQQTIQDAFDLWSTVDCNGSTSGLGQNAPQFQRVAGTGNPIDHSSCENPPQSNEMRFIATGWADHYINPNCNEPDDPDLVVGPGVVAITFNAWDRSTGTIGSSDISFNGEDYRFRVNRNRGQSGPDDWTECTSSGFDDSECFDLFSIAVHEIGHLLGLNHVQCTGAVMFPSSSAEEFEIEALTDNEEIGLCSLYPPIDASVSCDAGSDCRDFGERCTSNDECASDFCIKLDIPPATDGFIGWCSETCTKNSDCPTGFSCQETEIPYCADDDCSLTQEREDACRPSYLTLLDACECDTTEGECDDDGGSSCSCDPECTDTSSGGSDGGGTVPEAGELAEFCQPCFTNDDCENGLCVNEQDAESGEYGLCPATCNPSTNGADCPTGFSCLNFGDGGICWPDDRGTCDEVQSGRGTLDEICYYATAEGTWYNPCSPGLVCFGFRPQASQQIGQCVQYCDGDSPCSQGLTCCSNVDENGHCAVAVGEEAGGCFDIRVRGQTCREAENSICAVEDGCYLPPGKEVPRCYQECEDLVGDCAAGSSCIKYPETDASGNVVREFGLCCRNDRAGASDCEPLPLVPDRTLGTECTAATESECESQFCAVNPDAEQFGGVCSRHCNPATGIGCPSDEADVNGDGISDGGFVCKALGDGSVGACFPVKGTIDRYIPDTDIQLPEAGCGGCAGTPGDGVLAGLVLLGLSLFGARRKMRWLRQSA